MAPSQFTTTKPTRQIRAHQPTPDTILVYQAYSSAIADAAAATQNLAASPEYKAGSRMTWIKPSWCWMMYRSGYSYKDIRQERVLAITMRLEDFWDLLRRAVVNDDHRTSNGGGVVVVVAKQQIETEIRWGGEVVQVQWDPERGPRLERKDETRSIQIGIPRDLVEKWIREMILSIEDVTDRARSLKRTVDEDADSKETKGVEELMALGLLPREEVVCAPDDIRQRLGMD